MIKVTIWNEFCHEKTNEEVHEKFPDGMHEHLKRMLACDDFEIRTAWLEKDEEHGLSEDVLNDTDVLLWWGHARHGDVRDDKCHSKADGHDKRAEPELVAGLQHVERVQYEDGYGSRYEQEQLGGASLRHGPHAPSGEVGWSCSVLPAWVPSVLGALACLPPCSLLARSIWER